MKKANKKQIEEMAKRALEVMKQLEEMKSLYGEIDKITESLVELGINTLDVGDSKLLIVDNFAAKNTVFRTTSVKRYELKKVV